MQGKTRPPASNTPNPGHSREANPLLANLLYLLGSAAFAAGTLINMVRR